MSGFLSALEFLTRFRVRRTPAGSMQRVAAAQTWFPVVGLVIGATLAGTWWLASRALPEASVAVIVVVALVAITGGLHLDGLADAADGLLGGETPERRLAIMRDVHAGTYAVLAVVGVLALKWAGIAALPVAVRTETLIIVPCVSRWSMLVAIAAFPYARTEGDGAAFRAAAWPLPVLAGGAIAAAATVALLGPAGILVVPVAGGFALAAGAWAARLARGLTGDIYGAIVETGEAALLLFIAAFATRGWIDGW